MNLETLIVPLQMDTSKFEEGAKKAQSLSGSLSDGLAKVGGAVVLGGIAAVGAGIAALGGGLLYSVKAAAEAEDIQAQLNAVLKSTGGIAGVTAEQVNGLATSLSGVTKFEDDAIVSGENMLLTFTNIGKNVFPQATETMLDMSQALGQDLNASAIQLGKALNDPINGITALQRVGVKFTDAQKEMIASMVEAGDVEGAQALILKELQTEFGGSAVAAGQTFSGQLEILRNMLGNVGETVGGALLPVLTQLASTLVEKLNDPAIQAGIQNIANAIANFVSGVVENIPKAIAKFQEISSFLQEHKGIIIGILVALGVAVATFVYTTVIPAAIAMIAALAPIVLPILAIAAVVALLAEAWNNNWGGMRDTLTAVWNKILPIFNSIKTWLETTIPKVLDTFSKAVQWVVDVPLKNLKDVFESIKQKVENVIDKVKDMIDLIKNFHLPSWLQRHSPSPFEQPFIGVKDTLAELNKTSFPGLTDNLRNLNNVTNNWNLTIHSNAQSEDVVSDFNLLKAFAGV